jgi:hypothetical protein
MALPPLTRGGGLIREDEPCHRSHQHLRDNIGLGMWTDIHNINTLYEGEVYKHVDGRLSHEIGYAAVMRNKKVH